MGETDAQSDSDAMEIGSPADNPVPPDDGPLPPGDEPLPPGDKPLPPSGDGDDGEGGPVVPSLERSVTEPATAAGMVATCSAGVSHCSNQYYSLREYILWQKSSVEK